MKVGKVSNRKIIKQVLILALCVAAGWFLKARLTPQSPMMGMGQGGDPYVVVQEAQLKDVTPAKNYIAHVEAINDVSLQPQVSGYIEQVLFKEGSRVNEGDVLFVIEQQKYKATVDQRKAELDKAKASFIQLEKDYKRQNSLNKQQFASEAKLDEAYSAMLQAQAGVKQAEANYALAKIDLAHTEIKAPFSGVIGKALITKGNFVNTASGTLATIVQTNPVRVAFSITDKELTTLKQQDRQKDAEMYSKIILPNGTELKQEQLSFFSDNTVNPATATISVYSEFNNDNNLLIPGSYVNIRLGNGPQTNVIVISQAALSQDELGNYVMVVNIDNIVEQRRVVLGDVDEGQQIITKGLVVGDKVIVQGLQKVADGKKVRIGVAEK